MDIDQGILNAVEQAAQGAPSVRASKHTYTEKQINAELTRVIGFATDSTVLAKAQFDSEGLNDFAQSLVILQMRVFHRNLKQLTAESLADVVLVGFAAIIKDANLLTGMVQIVHLFADYLEERGLAQFGLTAKFDVVIEQRRPDIAAAAWEAEPVLGKPELFSNDPLTLAPFEVTNMFAQTEVGDVDFNDFIDQIARRRNPGQLRLAEGLFVTDHPIYYSLLGWAERLAHGSVNFPEEQVDIYVGALWAFAKGLTTAGLIDLAKVVHWYLKFCLDHELIQAREYAKLLKFSNRGIVRAVAIGPLTPDNMDLFPQWHEEGVALADKIFTKPNYTIDAVKAEKILGQLHLQPVATLMNPTIKLVLKKPLSEDQIMMERLRARDWAADTSKLLGDALSAADRVAYELAISNIHRYMTGNLNRQVKQWSGDSLEAAMIHLFQTEDGFDRKPAFLRYFQLYLGRLHDEGVIKSWSALHKGLDRAMYEYICCSTVRLLAESAR